MTTTSPVKIWRNQKKVRRLLGLSGIILTWSRIHVPPAGYTAQAPYVIAVALLEDGNKYIAQLADWEVRHLQINQKIRVVLRRTREAEQESIIPYGVKFKPVD